MGGGPSFERHWYAVRAEERPKGAIRGKGGHDGKRRETRRAQVAKLIHYSPPLCIVKQSRAGVQEGRQLLKSVTCVKVYTYKLLILITL